MDTDDLINLSPLRAAINAVLPESDTNSLAASSTESSIDPSTGKPSSLEAPNKATGTTEEAKLDDDEPESIDSDDESNDYRLMVNPDRPRKITEKRRLDNAAFQEWMIKNQREVTKASVAAAKNNLGSQSVASMVTGFEDKKIITSPREYQTELFERAKQKNTIVVLDTGMSVASFEYLF